MTIRPVFIEHAITKAEYDALELARPYTDPPIGTSSYARRSNDDAASRCFDEPDRPSGKPRWRAVGPARTIEGLARDDRRKGSP